MPARPLYRIQAELDPEAMSLQYREELQIPWDAEETRILFFHLYGNKFRGDHRAENAEIRILSISDEKGRSIPFSLEEEDQILRVELPKALKRGQVCVLYFEGSANIPLMSSEYGHGRDGEIQMGMFYPQLAVYDQNGWDNEKSQRNGDGRHAGTADFEFSVTAPENWQILCNGDDVSRDTKNGAGQWQFRAPERRDLVFCAFPDYRLREREVDGVLLRGAFNARAPEAVTDAVMDAAEQALRFYSRKLGPYPYRTLTVTNTAWSANAAYSKEYAGLVTVALGEELSTDQRLAAFHEIAHQWFYALVGNDENREPWLDESFATFFAFLCLDENDRQEWWCFLQRIGESFPAEKIDRPCDEVRDYILVIYYRGAWLLKQVMDCLGEETFCERLSDYCEQMAFQNASTEDFMRLVIRDDPALLALAEEYLSVLP